MQFFGVLHVTNETNMTRKQWISLKPADEVDIGVEVLVVQPPCLQEKKAKRSNFALLPGVGCGFEIKGNLY